MYCRLVFAHVLSLLLLVVQGALPTALAADASSSSKRPRNTVVVSAHKGDYADPIAAAKNALSGDRWCVSPQLPKHPCVMKILPGIYVLPETLRVPAGVALQGTETRSVLLLAGRGVSVGVISEGPLIADLSIVSDDGRALAFNQKLQRAAIAGGLTDLATAGIGHLAAHFDISDTEIVSSGAAISADNGSSLKVRDSRITGVGGVMQFSDVHSIKLKDTHITSRSGQQGTAALDVNNGVYGDVEIIGGSITSAAGNAIRLIDMFGGFLMVGTQVNGRVYLDKDSVEFVVFDGVSVTAPDTAINMSSVGAGEDILVPSMLVVRSFLNAPTALAVGISYPSSTEPLVVQESFIGGALSVFDIPARITRSVLIGSLQGEVLSCKNVYDRNYVLLKDTCPVQ